MGMRIRYSLDQASGMYVSTRMVPLPSGEVRIKYSPSSRVVLLVGADGAVKHTWTGTTNHELKISIKKKLIELGANFEAETRTRL